MDVKDETENRTEALAAEVLSLARDTLLVDLRFLDAALSRLTPEPRALPAALATDGRTLCYDPRVLLRAYRAAQSAPARALLHTVLHCVLRHFSVPPGAEREIWDLACDIAAEHTVDALGLASADGVREARQRKYCAALRAETGLLTAEKIYRRYRGAGLSPETLRELRADFRSDDHGLWGGAEDAERVWREVSRRMQVDMETFARRRGADAGALASGLREANRERSDYDAFLRRFAVRGEGLKLDPDEFDYGLYSYGLRLYGGRAPLIEQLEYRDARRAREFVVVPGFSEGFPAVTARALLEKTRAGLEATGSVRSRVDARVFPAGSDARAAFRAADALRRRGELPNLKGVLFLTDTPGAFPAKMPPYPAAFVFVNDDCSVPEVPPWAIRVVLQRDEIEDG